MRAQCEKERQISAGEAVKEKAKQTTSERQKGGGKIIARQYHLYFTCVSALICEGVSGFGLSHFQNPHFKSAHIVYSRGFSKSKTVGLPSDRRTPLSLIA